MAENSFIMLIKNIIYRDVPLAPYTTYRLGGKADYFTIVNNNTHFLQVINFAWEMEIPFFVLGCGANILIADEGFRGLVIKNESKKIQICNNNENTFLHASGGSIISDIINETTRHGYSGFEHYAGIPSTIGGALWQNLHFLSPDRKRTVYIAEIFERAHVLNRVTRRCEVLERNDFCFGYDTSILHQGNYVVLEALFRLTPSKPYVIHHQVEENLKWRNQHHPPYQIEYSCGSVFKKIEPQEYSI